MSNVQGIFNIKGPVSKVGVQELLNARMEPQQIISLIQLLVPKVLDLVKIVKVDFSSSLMGIKNLLQEFYLRKQLVIDYLNLALNLYHQKF